MPIELMIAYMLLGVLHVAEEDPAKAAQLKPLLLLASKTITGLYPPTPTLPTA